MASDRVILRPVKESDYNFIYGTWLNNLWYNKENTTTLTKDAFYKVHHIRVEKALKIKPAVIACTEFDPDLIVGYAVAVYPLWVYVKKDWRGIGVEEVLSEGIKSY
jgi:hypothetical protein